MFLFNTPLQVLDFVNNLVIPLENLPFNVFNRQYQPSWDQVMRSFAEKVEEIEVRVSDAVILGHRQCCNVFHWWDVIQKYRKPKNSSQVG